MFGDRVATRTVTPCSFVFRHRFPEHWLTFFRAYYGPTRKAFEALDPAGWTNLGNDILDLLHRFDRSGDATLLLASAKVGPMGRRTPRAAAAASPLGHRAYGTVRRSSPGPAGPGRVVAVGRGPGTLDRPQGRNRPGGADVISTRHATEDVRTREIPGRAAFRGHGTIMDTEDRAGLARALAILCGVGVVVGAMFPWYLADPDDGHSALSRGLADGLSGVGGWTILICGLAAIALLASRPRSTDARSLGAAVLFVVAVLCAAQDVLTVFDEYEEALRHVGLGLWLIVIGGTTGALMAAVHFCVAPPKQGCGLEADTAVRPTRTMIRGPRLLNGPPGRTAGATRGRADAALDRHAETYLD